jgi:hypothetical protein
MKPLLPLSAAASIALAGIGTPAQAHGPGYRSHHHVRGFVTLSIGAGPLYWGGPAYYPAMPPAYVTVAPPPAAYATAAPVEMLPPAQVAYPRSAQNAQQTEADWRECNRWATTQRSAMADAGVFQRSVASCMDTRGYSVR